MAICIRGKGSWKGNTRVNTPDSETTRVMMSMVKKISMRSLFAMFLMIGDERRRASILSN